MKRIAILAILTYMSFELVAQDNTAVKLKPTQINANFLSPGVSLEQRLSSSTSFLFEINISPIIQFNRVNGNIGNSDKTDVDFYLYPVVQTQVRRYYKRAQVKKSLDQNSGNYISFLGGYNFDPIYDNSERGNNDLGVFYAGPLWGMQRNYKSGFHLDLNLGLGFEFGNKASNEVVFLGGLTLGFTLK